MKVNTPLITSDALLCIAELVTIDTARLIHN